MPITNEHLADIDRAFSDNVLAELVDVDTRQHLMPSDEALAALGRVYGKTARELKIIFARGLGSS